MIPDETLSAVLNYDALGAELRAEYDRELARVTMADVVVQLFLLRISIEKKARKPEPIGRFARGDAAAAAVAGFSDKKAFLKWAARKGISPAPREGKPGINFWSRAQILRARELEGLT